MSAFAGAPRGTSPEMLDAVRTVDTDAVFAARIAPSPGKTTTVTDESRCNVCGSFVPIKAGDTHVVRDYAPSELGCTAARASAAAMRLRSLLRARIVSGAVLLAASALPTSVRGQTDASRLAGDCSFRFATHEVVTTYDRIADKTIVYAPIHCGDYEKTRLEIGALYDYHGQRRRSDGPAPSVQLTFEATTPVDGGEWQWLKFHDIELLIDDSTRVEFRGRLTDDDVVRDELRETIAVPVTIAVLRRLARAHRVDGRVGQTEFSLGPAELAAIRRLLLGLTAPPSGTGQ